MAAPNPSRIVNYTTTVSVAKSIDEIRGILRAHKARTVSEVYGDDGRVSAIEFAAETAWGLRYYRLPANPTAVLGMLITEKNKGKRTWDRFYVNPKDPPKALVEQAERTAWRTIKDWIQAQMALMVTSQVRFEQVFLGYETLNDAGLTVFDTYDQKQTALPAPHPA